MFSELVPDLILNTQLCKLTCSGNLKSFWIVRHKKRHARSMSALVLAWPLAFQVPQTETYINGLEPQLFMTEGGGHVQWGGFILLVLVSWRETTREDEKQHRVEEEIDEALREKWWWCWWKEHEKKQQILLADRGRQMRRIVEWVWLLRGGWVYHVEWDEARGEDWGKDTTASYKNRKPSKLEPEIPICISSCLS